MTKEKLEGLGHEYTDDYKRRVLAALLPGERPGMQRHLDRGSVNVSWLLSDAIRRIRRADTEDFVREDVLIDLLHEYWKFRREKYAREGKEDPMVQLDRRCPHCGQPLPKEL